MARKVIIGLCPTGMVPHKKQNPHVPLSVEEIIADALACAQQGASVIHIHARDEQGKPTWKKEVFAAIIAGIRAQNTDIILNVTTSGRNWSDFERRSECLDLRGDFKPDMASLTVGSMNFIRSASVNEPEMIEKLAIKMQERDIKPELEVFEPGMVHKTNQLIHKGVISKKSPWFNILLGSLGTSPLNAMSFAHFLSLLPTGALWSGAGIGDYQLDANVAALALGGNIRIGLEDNLYFNRSRTKLATNIELVHRMSNIIELMGLQIATPKQARKLLGLK